MSKSIILRTEEVFKTFKDRNTDESNFVATEHALIYVARGNIDVLFNGHLVAAVKENECFFVHKDSHITLVKYPSNEVGYNFFVMLSFPRHILFELYKTFPEEDLPKKKKITRVKDAVVKFNSSSMITSLFAAFRPYWLLGDQPEDAWLKMKVLEAVRIMSRIDEDAYAALFDFADRWRQDIMDFLENNYMYELTIDEIAHYTGRSTATFKRDFKKLSDLTPRNWLINRRLQAAHHLITTTSQPINRIMTDVGFKNFSHFSRVYRQLYGCTPTQSRTQSNK
jgi:AraC-like DNA-binding protein